MGRMKDLFMKITSEDFNYNLNKEPQYFEAKELCPNCLKNKLIETNKDDLYCINCGQDFIRVENSIRFK